MNIQEHKELLQNKSTKHLQQALKYTLESIAFLESIYMTGGENNHYSKEFSNAALEERQELCQRSSAIYSILRERSVLQ